MQIITAKQALMPSGWECDVRIGIADSGRIVLEPPVRSDPVRSGPVRSTIEHRVDLLLPAPCNLHSHSFQRAMSGLTEARGPDPRDSFWTWRRLMYRYLDRLTPQDVQTIAEMAFLEMLEAGYASVAEFHYLHHGPDGRPYDNLAEMSDRIICAAQEVGIGLTLLPVLYQWGGCDRRPLEDGQRRFGSEPEQFAQLFEAAQAHLSADARIGVAPHSLRAVDADGLALAQDLAADGPLHLHLAEQQAEVDEVKAHTGARPVDWLLANHDVTPNWCLIHCTQMNEAETVALARTGAVAGLCPITESSLGDGIFNGVAYQQAGGRFGVGSDSNIHISYFDELRTLEYSQRLRDRNRAALATQDKSTGRVLIEASLRGGAQAAGRQSGTIASGQWADLIGISTDNAWLCQRTGDTALDTLVFGGQGTRCLHDVWSAGRHVVTQGRHAKQVQITTAFQNCVERLGQMV